MLTALRVALGVAWATLVASELIAAQQGLGALIQNASSFFQLDIIYVGIICIGLIALAMDLALRAVDAPPRRVAGPDRMSARRVDSRRCASAGSSHRFDACRSTSRPRAGRCASSTTSPRHPPRRVRLDHRPVGLRQDDDDEHRRRLRQADARAACCSTASRSTGPGPDRGVIFQEYGVFPWLTVRGNIAFGLTLRGQPRRAPRERDEICERYMALMGLTDFADALAEACCRAACASGWRSRAPTRCSPSSC